MKSSTMRKLHETMGLAAEPVRLIDGTKREDAILVSGVFVRMVAKWRALVALLFGRVRGVMIIDRGRARDGDILAPVVVLDWETYARMAVGLRADKLPDMLDPMAEGDGWKHETGGSY